MSVTKLGASGERPDGYHIKRGSFYTGTVPKRLFEVYHVPILAMQLPKRVELREPVPQVVTYDGKLQG
jgi:hypothetical protein